MRKTNFKQGFIDLRTKLKTISTNDEWTLAKKLNDTVVLNFHHLNGKPQNREELLRSLERI